MDNQTYFDGDFWQCVQDTNAGESPDTTPAKWRRIRIPKTFRRVLAKLTFANLLELDGQTDKAQLHRSAGESMLDDLVRPEANRETCRNQTHGITTAPQANQPVKAQVIIEDAERLMRWDLDDLEASEEEDARDALSLALQQVWEAWWWESLMTCESMALRDTYADTVFYPQYSEVYFAANGKYYLAIQPSIGIAPAALQTDGSYLLNSGFWAEAAQSFAGNDVDNTVAYDWGDVVRNPDDGLFYQRGGSLQVSGTGTGAGFANQNYQVHPTANLTGRVVYWPGDAPSGDYNQASRFGANAPWIFTVIDNTPAVVASYAGGTAPAPLTPDLETGWTALTGSLPGPSFTRSFVAPAPGNAGHWGLLTAFDPVLDISRPVRSVTRLHPWLTRNPGPYEFSDAADGIRVPCWNHGTAYVLSRRPTPILTGNTFDETETYEATPTNEIVFDS